MNLDSTQTQDDIVRRVMNIKKFLLCLLIMLSFSSYVQASDSDKIELVVSPENMKAERYSSGIVMIAVKGKNGFSGQVTVSISGMPFGVYDNDSDPSDYFYCSSHCQSASNMDFPFTLNVKDGEWTTIGPTMNFASDKNSTSTVTIIASGGGTTVSKSFSLTLVNMNNADPQGYVSVNMDEFSRSLYKLNLTAGQSATLNFNANTRSTDPVTETLVSNLTSSGLSGITSTITGGFSQSQATVSNGSSQIVSISVQTSSNTPNGSYEILAGSTQNDGSTMLGHGISLIVTGSSNATTADQDTSLNNSDNSSNSDQNSTSSGGSTSTISKTKQSSTPSPIVSTNSSSIASPVVSDSPNIIKNVNNKSRKNNSYYLIPLSIILASLIFFLIWYRKKRRQKNLNLRFKILDKEIKI